jgi:hypothetical protein
VLLLASRRGTELRILKSRGGRPVTLHDVLTDTTG